MIAMALVCTSACFEQERPRTRFVGGSGFRAVCGDDRAEGLEACDGTDLDNLTCDALGLGAGALRCALDCSFDTSGCEFQPEGDAQRNAGGDPERGRCKQRLGGDAECPPGDYAYDGDFERGPPVPGDVAWRVPPSPDGEGFFGDHRRTPPTPDGEGFFFGDHRRMPPMPDGEGAWFGDPGGPTGPTGPTPFGDAGYGPTGPGGD